MINRTLGTIKNEIRNNLSKIIVVLLMTLIAMTLSAVVGLTNASPEATLTATNFQGGEESSGFFETDANRATFKNQYDKNSYYAYKTHNIMPRKITDVNARYQNSLFCLDNTLEFPQGNGVVYQNIGELRTVNTINTRNGEKALTPEQKNKLYWLFNQMYLREETKEVKNAYKTELFKNAFAHSNGDANDAEKLELALRKYNVEVTEDDLAVIEQWAIWYIINGDDTFRLEGAKMLSDASNEITATPDKKIHRQRVYEYLKAGIDANGSATFKENVPENYSILDNTNLTYTKLEDGKPEFKYIKLNVPTNYNMELKDFKVHYMDKAGQVNREIPRSMLSIYMKSDESREVRYSLKEAALKGEFKLKINESMPENAGGIVLVPKVVQKSLTANVFIPKDAEAKKVNQPVVNIERNVKEAEYPYGIRIVTRENRENDLALRKFITAVNGVAPTVSRRPILDASTDRNGILQNGTGTTITYKHPKNPLQVQVGDTVKYEIRVYNEETTDGVVTEIHDKLPSHLKLKENSDINRTYGWRQLENNVISSNYLNGKVIPGMKVKEGNSLSISQGYVEVELVVASEATDKEILTNIASIAGQNPSNDRDSAPGNVRYPNNLNTYKGNDQNKNELGDKDYFYKGQEDDDDFEKVIVNKPLPKNFDLALRKFITSINGKAPEVSREPVVDVTPLKNKTRQTATYTHPKNPLDVDKGNVVIYKLRVYNEAELPGKATEIADYIPSGLKFLPEHQINKKYGWRVQDNKVITNYLQNEEIRPFTNESTTLDYKDVEIALEVVDGSDLKNIAEINRDQNTENRRDRDSVPGNVKTREYGNKNQEDDDDFEPLKLRNREFDLALRKFIISINGKAPEVSREPVVDTTQLKSKASTTATYTHPKNPLKVKTGDTVIYKLRVYNEAEIPGAIEKISDYIPAGLEFLPEHSVNKKYGWKVEGNKLVTEYYKTNMTKEEKDSILSSRQIPAKYADKMIRPFDGKSDRLDYKEVEVALKVIAKRQEGDNLKNIAEIEEDYSKIENKKVISDRDSVPGNVRTKEYGTKSQEDDDDFEPLKLEELEFDLALRKFITAIEPKDYKESTNQPENINHGTDDLFGVPSRENINNTNTVNRNSDNANSSNSINSNRNNSRNTFNSNDRRENSNNNSNKIEKRKREEYKDREPKVDVSKLKNKTEKSATYTHPKNPLLVVPEDRVEYTIRVYNEGDIDGYAEKISDNIPKGLEFLPDDEINKKYGWVKEGETVVTKYLSREESNKRNENAILKAYNGGDTLNYKDVKIAFRVSKDYKASNGAIKNIAEITEDWNEYGFPDRDSIPGNKKPNEDDEDYDQIIPTEFDLALRKIVSKIIITENGKERTINTNHKYEDDPESVAKADLKAKMLDKTEVKWEYKIRVTNQGTLEGYAKEVTDYIPEGTYFDAKDNPQWFKKDENTVATKALADKLLKPGESQELTIYLRWKKDPKNLGVKTNWAEISEDENKYGIPDKDSVPGNKKPKEDDIDDAPVALAIVTGRALMNVVYFLLAGTTVTVSLLVYNKNKK